MEDLNPARYEAPNTTTEPAKAVKVMIFLSLSESECEHRKVTDALVAKHGGRIVKTTGDGVLLEFPSVVDLVRRRLVKQRNSPLVPGLEVR